MERQPSGDVHAAGVDLDAALLNLQADIGHHDTARKLQAARDLGLDMASSWMIGDQSRDISAGRAAGCRTVLVGGGEADPEIEPTACATDFTEAVDLLLATGRPGRGRLPERNELASLRRAIEDLAESRGRADNGMSRGVGLTLLALSGFPFVGAILMLEDTDAFLRWILATTVLLLASIAVLLAGRR